MKELVSSLSQATANRLKSPLIGTFALCWIAVNHTFVTELLLLPNEDRIDLVRSAAFDWSSDVFYPTLLVFVYLFIIPLVQWRLDIIKYQAVEKHRTRTQHGQLKAKYESLARVSEIQSKSSVDYWREYHKNHAESAGKQIILLKQQLADSKSRIRELENDVRVASHNYENLNNTNNKMADELNDERSSHNKTKNLLEDSIDECEKSKRLSIEAYHWNDLAIKKLSKLYSDDETLRKVELLVENTQSHMVNTIVKIRDNNTRAKIERDFSQIKTELIKQNKEIKYSLSTISNYLDSFSAKFSELPIDMYMLDENSGELITREANDYYSAESSKSL